MGIYGNLLMIQEQQELEVNILREFDIIYESEQTKKSIIQKIVELIERFKQFILRKIKEIKQKLAKLFSKRKDKIEELEKKAKEDVDKEKDTASNNKEDKSSDNQQEEKPFEEFEIEYCPIYDDEVVLISRLRNSLVGTSWTDIENIDSYTKSINADLKEYDKIIKGMNNVNLKTEKIIIHSKKELEDFKQELARCNHLTDKLIGNPVNNDFVKAAGEIVTVMTKLGQDIKSLENKNIDGDLNQLITSVKNVISMLTNANDAAGKLMAQFYMADSVNTTANFDIKYR